MFAGFTPDPKDSPEKLKNPENKSEKELTPEEQAELEKNATAWENQMADAPAFGAATGETTAGESAQEGTGDGGITMPDIPPVDPTSASAAVLAGAVVAPAEMIAPTAPTAPENPDNVANVDNVNQRNDDNVLEATARRQAQQYDTNIQHLVQNAGGNMPNGREAIIQASMDAKSEVNSAQAETAMDNLGVRVANGQTDGAAEAENGLVAGMTAAAGMKVAAEKAAIETTSNHPNAETSVAEAQAAIAKTEQLKESLGQTAAIVQNQEAMRQVNQGVQSIENELQASQDLLDAATTEMAEKDEAEQNETDAENNRLQTLEEEQNASEATDEFAAGQMNVDAVKKMQEEKKEKEDAAKKAMEAKGAEAADEDMSSRRAIYG